MKPLLIKNELTKVVEEVEDVDFESGEIRELIVKPGLSASPPQFPGITLKRKKGNKIK